MKQDDAIKDFYEAIVDILGQYHSSLKPSKYDQYMDASGNLVFPQKKAKG